MVWRFIGNWVLCCIVYSLVHGDEKKQSQPPFLESNFPWSEKLNKKVLKKHLNDTFVYWWNCIATCFPILWCGEKRIPPFLKGNFPHNLEFKIKVCISQKTHLWHHEISLLFNEELYNDSRHIGELGSYSSWPFRISINEAMRMKFPPTTPQS